MRESGVILVVGDGASAWGRNIGNLPPNHWTWVHAESGGQALQMLARRSIGLVLVSSPLPDMSGFDLATRIRQLAQHGEVPILLIPAFGHAELPVPISGGDWGLVEVTPPTISPDSLLKRINRHLSQQSQPSTHFHMGGFAELLHSAQIVLWEADADSLEFRFISGDLAGMLGQCNGWADAAPRSLMDLIHPDDRERVGQLLRCVTTGRAARRVECRLVARNRRVVWVRNVFMPPVPVGRSLLLRGVLTHITDQKRMARQLTAFVALGRKLSGAQTAAEAAEVILVAADELIGWDACWVDFYDPVGNRIHPILNFDLVDGIRQKVPPPEVDGPPSGMALKAIREGGLLISRRSTELAQLETIPFGDKSRPSGSILVVPVRHQGGVIAVMSIQRYGDHAYQPEDLAGFEALADYCGGALAQIQARESIKTSEARFATLFHSSPAAIAMNTVVDGRLIEVNSRYCEFLGYAREELIGKTVGELGLWANPADRAPVMQKLLETKSLRSVETRFRRKSGELRDVLVSLEVVDVPGESQPVLIAQFEDVTEHRRAERAIKESEERFRQLAENIEEVFWLTTPDKSEMLYISPSYERVWGRPCRDLYEHPTSWMEQIHPEDRPHVVAEAGRQFAGEYDVQYRVVRPDGTIRWVSDRAFPIRDEAGNIYRVAGLARDITSQKTSELELRLSEERFRLLAKATRDAIWDWNVPTGELWWNEGFQELFGYTQSEVNPTIHAWAQLVHPEDIAEVNASLDRAFQAGDLGWMSEYRFRRGDGQYAHVLDRGHIMRDSAGRVVRMIGGMTDLTAWKLAQSRLVEQATLLDHATDAIFVCDLNQKVRYWNHGAERLYGWNAEEARGLSILESLHPDPAILKEPLETLKNQGVWQGELEHRTKEGKIVTTLCRWTRMGGGGAGDSMLAIHADITERKRIEQQLLRAQRMESIGTLAGGIAHDLNNALAPILMSIDLLKLDEVDPERLMVLENIERSAQHGADLVQQVLSFARGVQGHRVPVQIRHLVREIEQIIKDTFPKNIHLTVRVPKDLWMVLADATHLRQVLMNLCVNARDAMPHGGQLIVGVENVHLDEVYVGMNPGAKSGPHVMIVVEDNGMGIPRDLQERIFEPFFTTKGPGKGTGLGLATVLSIVKGHDGFLQLESEKGSGSKFKIYLPATAEAPQVAEAMLDQERFPRGAGELVMVVDDEDSIRAVAQRTLERFGYRVVPASNGAEAVALYARIGREINVVLTDMAMPVMDGVATVFALQAINPSIRIIASSGQTTGGSMATIQAAGVRHFVPKPYTAEALLKALREALA